MRRAARRVERVASCAGRDWSVPVRRWTESWPVVELSVSAYGVVWVVWEGVVVVVLTLAEFAAARLELRDQRCDFGFLRFERCFGFPELRFQRCVFGLLDEERRVVGYGAEELLFGDLLDVGEAQF